jgi:hypothetical protein
MLLLVARQRRASWQCPRMACTTLSGVRALFRKRRNDLSSVFRVMIFMPYPYVRFNYSLRLKILDSDSG